MNVNFEYYKIFYYVAKYNNFTKAAHVLNNSQPNITRAMNCLEHELNCTLFVRTNRGVCLILSTSTKAPSKYGRILITICGVKKRKIPSTMTITPVNRSRIVAFSFSAV